ncbi:aminotransferase class III-fold pyridoxal phosphate-dependent enzyme [bacterium]|nr:aminotransferase class III-fold pyridoxal phosphate-dependent enzyme [bacterium]
MGNYKYTSPDIGPRAQALIQRDKKVYFGAHTRSPEIPLVVDHGQGCMIYDVDGNEFLDFGAGYAVASTGHCHPEVVEAIQTQAERLLHLPGSDFFYELQTELAEKLANWAPGNFPKQVYFGSSGAEMVDSALKLAKYYTGRYKLISFFGAFHGRTFGGMTVCGSKYVQRAGFGPLVPEVYHTLYPYCYRCPLGKTYPDCKKGVETLEGIPLLPCVAFLNNEIFRRLINPYEVAALLVEPIQGEGGYIVPPPEFHPLLRAITSKYGIIYIVDDIQAGLGRSGRMFTTEHWGVAADVNIIAKGLASGIPIGAIIARSELMDPELDNHAWVPGSHGSTFGGNPIASIAALKTLELIHGKLMKNAREMGLYLMENLLELQNKHRIIGEVRGIGLMIGIEIVQDKISKTPFPENFTTDGKNIKSVIVGNAYKKGMIIFGCGFNSIRLSPPLIVNKAEADQCLRTLDEIFTEIESNL